MKETRRRFEWFSFYDHTGLEAHLEYMAGRGWLLEKIGNFTWHYRRIEPKKLTFSVSYFPKATLFDPGPSDKQETFYDFCAHTGWTLAATSAQMQVFYNERPNPVPIDTDPALEVDAIHRSAKKNWLVSQILLLAVGVMNFAQYLWRLAHDPINTLSSPLCLFSMVVWPMLFLIIGVDLATYFLWRRRALKAAEQGEFLATRSHPLLQKLALAVVLIGLAWCLACLRGGMLAITVLSLTGTLGIVIVVVQLRETLKRNRAPAGFNRLVTYGACIVLPVVMVSLVMAVVLRTDVLRREEPDGLPLALDDLVEMSFDGELDQSMQFDQSPLLAVLVANQYLWRSADAARPAPHWLQYTVTEVRAPFLYDMCKNDLLYENDTRGTSLLPVKYYAPIDPAPWGAVEAYQFMMEDEDFGGLLDLYLLCYEDRIVKLDPDWELTPAQMAIVGEKLGGRQAP